ncbi:TonB-dependent receptor domain-containing protein, partial [Roseateles sp. P5_E11]
MLVRLVASKQGAGSTSVGFNGQKAEFIAPAVTYRNKAWGTEVTAQYEYQDRYKPPYPLVVTNGTSLSEDLPLHRFEPASDGTTTKTKVATFTLNQRLGEDWDLSIKYTDDRRGNDAQNVTTFPGYFFGLPLSEQMSLAFNSGNSYKSKIGKVELKHDFETGPLEHHFLAAIDYTSSRISTHNQQTAITSTDTVTGVVTDLGPVFGPAFGGIPGPMVFGGQSPKDKGLLFMDQIIWDKWTALLGMRFIRFEANNDTKVTPEFKKTLPSLGVLYRVTPNVSLYANASKGFLPNAGNFQFDGSGVPPENASQYEL